MVKKDEHSKKEQRYKRGQNPNSLKNLKLFKPGESGNPVGKEPGTLDRATTLKKWAYVAIDLMNPVTKTLERATVEDEVVLSLIREARKGSVPAIKEFMDTLYGKVPDKIEANIGIRKVEIEWEDVVIGANIPDAEALIN